MKFTQETDLIKVLGWSVSSKILYVWRMMKNNKTEEEIYNHLVKETKVIHHKTYKQIINRIDKIKDSISFI